MNNTTRYLTLIVVLNFSCIGGALFAQEGGDGVTVYSLADDFSYTDNGTASTWSYRLDGTADPSPSFPLLPLAKRDANALWGSEFPKPPLMWSGDTGYWGIGKNLSGRKQLSPVNGTTWAPGEVLLHPSPSGLAVAWTAPADMVIDVRYAFGLASPQSRGIGYRILKRSGAVETEIVALSNIGSKISNELSGLAVATGDQLFFRFDTAGDPGGDIVRAAITIEGSPGSPPTAPQPAGATITASSDFTLTAPGDGRRTLSNG